MRLRPPARAVLLAAVALAAGLSVSGDTCVDCLCHCKSGDTIRLQYYTGFDCGQRCENGPGGCGVGKVNSVECVQTKIVDGRPTSVRCAEAAAPPVAAPARAASPRR